VQYSKNRTEAVKKKRKEIIIFFFQKGGGREDTLQLGVVTPRGGRSNCGGGKGHILVGFLPKNLITTKEM